MLRLASIFWTCALHREAKPHILLLACATLDQSTPSSAQPLARLNWRSMSKQLAFRAFGCTNLMPQNVSAFPLQLEYKDSNEAHLIVSSWMLRAVVSVSCHIRQKLGSTWPFLTEVDIRGYLGMITGQRPRISCETTLPLLLEFASYQRKLFSVAIQMVRPGGILVYSTCTLNPYECEGVVGWALQTYPQLRLLQAEPGVGQGGLRGCGLPDHLCPAVQRFHPSQPDIDTIGFFIAKFALEHQPLAAHLPLSTEPAAPVAD
eukprot:m.271511 g.271511  ORF g.271511 m.271511 type:complete len:261 (-) comp54780_c0_seq5:53-835(-)